MAVTDHLAAVDTAHRHLGGQAGVAEARDPRVHVETLLEACRAGEAVAGVDEEQLDALRDQPVPRVADGVQVGRQRLVAVDQVVGEVDVGLGVGVGEPDLDREAETVADGGLGHGTLQAGTGGAD